MAIIDGTNANDTLTGTAGADTINGGKGADILIGLGGNDDYYVDNAADAVIEQANGGSDAVFTSVSIGTLWANVENATLTGAANLSLGGNSLNNFLVGNSGANVIDGGAGPDTMIGLGGSDTYIVDDANDAVVETIAGAAGGIDLVKSSVDFALTANIENLTLLGPFNLNGTGNNLNNVLTGNTGDNILNGMAGADTMIGGEGNDTYYVDNIGDKVVETVSNAQGGGTDTVVSSINFSIASYANIDNLTLQGSKDGSTATGNALANTITGDGFRNVINGGAGADTMIGGAGDDTYYVDNIGDQVTENAGEGTDTVISTVALTNAFANVENYTFQTSTGIYFTGSSTGNNVINGGNGNDVLKDGGGNIDQLHGNAGSDLLIGTAGFDALDGGAGDDVLDGSKSGFSHLTGGSGNDIMMGGTGSDIFDGDLGAATGSDMMIGGDGSDIYYIDNLGDKVIENAGEGTFDGVYSTISINKLFDNVENASLLSSANLNLTGNDLINTLIGNSGNNIINGGAGADEMAGALGNDTYYVDDVGDVVSEIPGGGADTVISSVSFQLLSDVENLTLTGIALNATGNALNNILTGDGMMNILDGGAGADTMIGGKGSDIYYVDNVGDKVVESVTNPNGGGNDTVRSSINFSIATLVNVDNIELQGTGDLNATGNALSNHIVGTDGNNVLNGGASNDYLVGGKGNDTYYFDNAQDQLKENAGEGIDTLISSVPLATYLSNVENYTFTTASAVHFAGSTDDNVITGGAGADTLTGGGGWDHLNGGAGNDQLVGGSAFDVLDGGIGADKMAGGDSDDVYYVDNAGDIVTELLNAGNDSVFSSISISKLYDNVENAQLLGAAALNLTGNDLDNFLAGNNAANKISGGNGADYLYGRQGNDTLTGGLGADTFAFDLSQAVGNDGKDLVTDFTKATDILQFNLGDVNHDNTINLADLIASTKSILDHGAGMAVDVTFKNGSQITFTGAGTGSVSSIADLVSNSGTQIHLT